MCANHWCPSRRQRYLGTATQPRPSRMYLPTTRPSPPTAWRQPVGPASRLGCTTPIDARGSRGVVESVSLTLAFFPGAATIEVARRSPTPPLPEGDSDQTRPRCVLSLKSDSMIESTRAGAFFNGCLAALDHDVSNWFRATCAAWVPWGDGEVSLGRLLLDGTCLWICRSHGYHRPGC